MVERRRTEGGASAPPVLVGVGSDGTHVHLTLWTGTTSTTKIMRPLETIALAERILREAVKLLPRKKGDAGVALRRDAKEDE